MSFERFHRSQTNLCLFQTVGYIRFSWTFTSSLQSERFVRPNIAYRMIYLTYNTIDFQSNEKNDFPRTSLPHKKVWSDVPQIINRICTNSHSLVVTDIQKFAENINFWQRYFIHPNRPKWEWLRILKTLGLKTPRIQRNLYICIYKLNMDSFDDFKKYKMLIYRLVLTFWK